MNDTCAFLDLVMHCDLKKVVGQAINAGTGRSLSVLEIARKVVRKMGKSEDRIQCVSDRPGQVFRHTADPAKAERLLGWKAATSFDAGLDQTIEWYRANPKWWSKQLWLRDMPIVTKTGKTEMH